MLSFLGYNRHLSTLCLRIMGVVAMLLRSLRFRVVFVSDRSIFKYYYEALLNNADWCAIDWFLFRTERTRRKYNCKYSRDWHRTCDQRDTKTTLAGRPTLTRHAPTVSDDGQREKKTTLKFRTGTVTITDIITKRKSYPFYHLAP